MRQLPSRLRRLDDALADLPLDAPMLLTELDGFLTGVLVCPDAIPPGEWLPIVWEGTESDPPFDDPADMGWFTDALTARCSEIARDLGRGKPQPILDVDERNGDLLWEAWIEGLATAMTLRPESWARVSDGDDEAAADALARLSLLIAIARDESGLDSVAVNAAHDDAAADIAAGVSRLYTFRLLHGDPHPIVPAARPAKVGRNEACPCGSGRKSKRCCG